MPDRAKFLGDLSQALTDLSTGLLFFELELNRIDDAVLEAAFAADAGAGALPALVRRAAQGQALPARRQGRGAVPREVGDRRAGLEPAVRRDDGERSNSTSMARSSASRRRCTCCRDTDEKQARGGVRRRSARRSTTMRGCSPTSPMCSPRTRKSPTAGAATRTSPTAGTWPIRSSAKWSMRCETAVTRGLSAAQSHRYYAMKAKWFGKDQLNAWDRNAPLPTSDERTVRLGAAPRPR